METVMLYFTCSATERVSTIDQKCRKNQLSVCTDGIKLGVTKSVVHNLEDTSSSLL